MHSIPVRRMRFEVPQADFHPIYVAGQTALSYHFTGLGLYVALLEPFIVKSARRVLPRITDPELAEEVDRFCRQEAQHYQQHERFNALIFAQDYPGLTERYEALRADFARMLDAEDDRYRLGFIEGFEANTTQGALHLLKSGVLRHPDTDPRFGELWTWHMLEEIEHRNVAFDLYQHLYGDWLFRARMCWVAQSHMAKFIADCTRIMSAADVPRYGDACRIRLRDRFQRVAMRMVPRVVSMMPGYTPHHYELPPQVARLSERFTARAESAT
ncbi:MAG: metal-dependent hydrolase [Pseudomonadales bacterium]